MRLGSDQYVSFLLDRTRVTCRQEGYSSSTEKRYLYWVRRFLNDVEVAAPKDLRPESARAFLRTLQDCTYSTKNQARNALSFFFDEVLAGPIGDGIGLTAEPGQDQWGSPLQTGASIKIESSSAGLGRSATRIGRGAVAHRREHGAAGDTGAGGRIRH